MEDLNSLPSPTRFKISTHKEIYIRITESGVYNVLSQLGSYKTEGPDNIPARVLKELAVDLAPIYVCLFIYISSLWILVNYHKSGKQHCKKFIFDMYSHQ